MGGHSVIGTCPSGKSACADAAIGAGEASDASVAMGVCGSVCCGVVAAQLAVSARGASTEGAGGGTVEDGSDERAVVKACC